jgi:hypothetical protein
MRTASGSEPVRSSTSGGTDDGAVDGEEDMAGDAADREQLGFWGGLWAALRFGRGHNDETRAEGWRKDGNSIETATSLREKKGRPLLAPLSTLIIALLL